MPLGEIRDVSKEREGENENGCGGDPKVAKRSAESTLPEWLSKELVGKLQQLGMWR